MLQLETATAKLDSTATMKSHSLQISKPKEESEGSVAFEDEAGQFKRGNVRDSKPRVHRAIQPRLKWYQSVKRAADLAGGIVLLILLSPCIALGALLVKLTSRGPAFYRQVRVGMNGREFTLVKLRTMRHNAEAQTGPVWLTEFDSRVTTFGKLLRSSHIDEFPQLWNVIRGEMSLVGPRPERPEFVTKLDVEIPCYRERLQVKPGITGLAQLKLPADTTLESVRRKVEHDIYYVEQCNPWLDLKLMIFTAWQLIREVAHFVGACFVLPTDDEIHRDFRQSLGTSHDDFGVARFPGSTMPQSFIDTKIEIPEVRS